MSPVIDSVSRACFSRHVWLLVCPTEIATHDPKSFYIRRLIVAISVGKRSVSKVIDSIINIALRAHYSDAARRYVKVLGRLK